MHSSYMQGYTHSATNHTSSPRPSYPDRLIAVTRRCPYTLPYGHPINPRVPAVMDRHGGVAYFPSASNIQDRCNFSCNLSRQVAKSRRETERTQSHLKAAGKMAAGMHKYVNSERTAAVLCLFDHLGTKKKKTFYSLAETLSRSQSFCISYWWIINSHGLVCSANRVLLPLLYVSQARFVCTWKGREVCFPCLWPLQCPIVGH